MLQAIVSFKTLPKKFNGLKPDERKEIKCAVHANITKKCNKI